MGKVTIMKVSELAELESSDFAGVLMCDVMGVLCDTWDEYLEGNAHEDDVHPSDLEHGGPCNYIEHLKNAIKEDGGMLNPIDIEYGRVVDGHHRLLAAIELQLDSVPVIIHE